MARKVDYLKGEKIGASTFIREVEPEVILNEGTRKRIRRKALFICSCGKEFTGIIDKVKYGKKSCGCFQKLKIEKLKNKNIKHGMRSHPLYYIWSNMIYRCCDISNDDYYGRGIKVCERWKNIDNFIKDMFPTYSKNLQLDRINNNGNYEPSNCRWVSRKQNCNNRRNTIFIEHEGLTKSISQWSEITGIPHNVILKRYKNWRVEKVLTTPYIKKIEK